MPVRLLDPGRVVQSCSTVILAACRVVRKEPADLVRQREFRLDEFPDRGRRELFRHRADPEDQFRRDRNGKLDVGEAVAPAQDGLPVPDDDDGRAGPRRRIGVREDSIEPSGEILFPFRARDRQHGRGQKENPSREDASSRRLARKPWSRI
jgi:hypothetical protein